MLVLSNDNDCSTKKTFALFFGGLRGPKKQEFGNLWQRNAFQKKGHSGADMLHTLSIPSHTWVST